MGLKSWAFRLSIQDIDANYYADAPGSTFCQECGCVVDRDFVPPALRLHSGASRDVGHTLDGKVICRSRFRSFCERESIHAEFRSIPGHSDLFIFCALKALPFNPDIRPVQFIDKCAVCGQYKEVVGSLPPYFDIDPDDAIRGIFRSDIEFGPCRSRAPLLIVDRTTGEALRTSRFKGLTLVEIPFDAARRARS